MSAMKNDRQLPPEIKGSLKLQGTVSLVLAVWQNCCASIVFHSKKVWENTVLLSWGSPWPPELMPLEE